MGLRGNKSMSRKAWRDLGNQVLRGALVDIVPVQRKRTRDRAPFRLFKPGNLILGNRLAIILR